MSTAAEVAEETQEREHQERREERATGNQEQRGVPVPHGNETPTEDNNRDQEQEMNGRLEFMRVLKEATEDTVRLMGDLDRCRVLLTEELEGHQSVRRNKRS